MDYDKAMQHWDSWVAHIASGGRGSFPRDGFESYLDLIQELEQQLECERHQSARYAQGYRQLNECVRLNDKLRKALEQLVKNAVPIMKRRTDGVEVETGYSEVPSALITEAEQALGEGVGHGTNTA